jgi:hypothetical protein
MLKTRTQGEGRLVCVYIDQPSLDTLKRLQEDAGLSRSAALREVLRKEAKRIYRVDARKGQEAPIQP